MSLSVERVKYLKEFAAKSFNDPALLMSKEEGLIAADILTSLDELLAIKEAKPVAVVKAWLEDRNYIEWIDGASIPDGALLIRKPE